METIIKILNHELSMDMGTKFTPIIIKSKVWHYILIAIGVSIFIIYTR